MHCIIQAVTDATFPHVLRPMKGRAVIDYLINDALRQKDIANITILSGEQTKKILSKHIGNAFPGEKIEVSSSPLNSIVKKGEDVMILQGNIVTSLKLQNFIRYYKQFKTVTKAAVDKTSPQEIPFIIIPGKYYDKLDSLPSNISIHTYNCGTGYCII